MQVRAGPPVIAEVGLMMAIVGIGLSILNVTSFDVVPPPPGVGLKTVIFALPPVAISRAGIAAVSALLLTNVVVRFDPFHCTVEP